MYPEISALITPPKDPNEQPLTAATPIPNTISSSGNSIQPSYHRPEEPFTPIESSAESERNYSELLNDFEPLPYTCNILEGPCRPNNVINNNLWQLVCNSDHTQAENEDGDQKQFEGKYSSPIGLTEGHITLGNPGSRKDEPENNEIKPQLPDDKAEAYAEKPPPYPQNQWPMYHPPPYYWYHPYHYRYQHPYGAQDDQPNSRRLSRPTLYPKPQNGHYHHAYPYRSSAPYGHFGTPPFVASYPKPTAHQEYITDLTNNDVICG